MSNSDISKKSAGRAAAGLVSDGMIVGLGTGSTVKYFIEGLAERIKKESLDVVGIPTSVATERLASGLGIKLSTLREHPRIDLDVDGADEVDPGFNLIKGGGGAHTREKIVACASKRFIVVVDESKMVGRLGAFPVPLEAVSYAEDYVIREVAALGGITRRRTGFTTDNGNIVLDARMNIVDPIKLEEQLNNIAGVVECGIFARRKPEKVLIGRKDIVEEKERE